MPLKARGLAGRLEARAAGLGAGASVVMAASVADGASVLECGYGSGTGRRICERSRAGQASRADTPAPRVPFLDDALTSVTVGCDAMSAPLAPVPRAHDLRATTRTRRDPRWGPRWRCGGPRRATQVRPADRSGVRGDAGTRRHRRPERPGRRGPWPAPRSDRT